MDRSINGIFAAIDVARIDPRESNKLETKRYDGNGWIGDLRRGEYVGFGPLARQSNGYQVMLLMS